MRCLRFLYIAWNTYHLYCSGGGPHEAASNGICSTNSHSVRLGPVYPGIVDVKSFSHAAICAVNGRPGPAMKYGSWLCVGDEGGPRGSGVMPSGFVQPPATAASHVVTIPIAASYALVPAFCSSRQIL